MNKFKFLKIRIKVPNTFAQSTAFGTCSDTLEVFTGCSTQSATSSLAFSLSEYFICLCSQSFTISKADRRTMIICLITIRAKIMVSMRLMSKKTQKNIKVSILIDVDGILLVDM